MFILWIQNNASWQSICLLVLASLVSVDASNKRGLTNAKNFYMCEDLDQFPNIGWWYDWGISSGYHTNRYACTNTLKANRIPMVWGWNQDPDKRFKFSEQSEYVLGFNEPNHQKQAYMSPEDAAVRWRELETAAKANGAKYFISPSAAPGGADADNYIEWFDTFFANCLDCQIDYLATHHYSWSCNPQEVKNFLTNLHNRYNMSIWLTEFSCPRITDIDQQLEFMKELLPWLESTSFVNRYAWYTTRITLTNRYIKPSASLLEADESKLTALGEFYNNFTP